MTPEEKAEAFESLVDSLLNVYTNGRWAWICPTPSGGVQRETRAEAVADLLAWAAATAPKQRTICTQRAGNATAGERGD